MTSVVRTLVVGIVLAGGLVLGATAAEATAGTCQVFTFDGTGDSPDAGFSFCSTGVGVHKVVIECDPGWWSANYYRFGVWRPVGDYSVAECDVDDDLVDARLVLG